MEYNLFTRLFKYTEKSRYSPLENYLTEQFAYLLQYLDKIDKSARIELLDILKIESSQFPEIQIETQCSFWVESLGHNARPDIKIVIDKMVYFIEVKVESNLNVYENCNQIQLYEAINVPSLENKGVRLLSKYAMKVNNRQYNKFSDEHQILWNKIYNFFKKFTKEKNDILINNFLGFLEEFGMGEKKALQYDVSSGLENFYSLYGFLYEMVQRFACREGYTPNGVKFNGCEAFFGFDISYFKQNVIWIGCFNNEEKDLVVMSYADESELLDKLKEIDDEAACIDGIYASFPMAKLLENNPTFEEQERIFDDWLNKNHVHDILRESWDLINK